MADIMSKPARPSGALTGRHVLYILFGFFGIIFAANAALVYWAESTFSGLEVESSYKAGQEFPEQMAEAQEQAARQWTVNAHPALAANGDLTVTASFTGPDGKPIYGLDVNVTLEHPADRRRDVVLDLATAGGGQYAASAEGVPPGLRDLVLVAGSNGKRVYLSRSQIFLKAGE
ncbi:putative integral membrane protein linked to a cation pump [Hartmannibacter diazotrophicus]|uniref:Putative integral membrane protein linked to a cation pump n=1 Tax=Hartmannibacter diazotrophicus TaxID=1482074 RepID=A0A2C9DD84_9HYPH|nr:FixH family protein [Hartmannibacter diazotrophicus]SON58302.1 putative integral membrane protein linked to a cation pump [Hartmannibacter diazotrophicus]